MRVDEASTGFLVESVVKFIHWRVRWAFMLSSHVLDNVWLIRLAKIVTFVSSVCKAIRSKTVIKSSCKLLGQKAEWPAEVIVDKASCTIVCQSRKVRVEVDDSARTCFFVEDILDWCWSI